MWLYEKGVTPPPPVDTNRAPLAALDADRQSGPVPLTVRFSGARSSDPDGDAIASYSFDFGDGSPVQDGTAAVVSHTYNTAGTFSATLTVKDSKNKLSELPSTLTITAGGSTGANVPPTARVVAGPTTGPAPLKVLLNASASDAGEASDAIVLYTFGCGTGAKVSQTTATHSCDYPNPGTFVCEVTVRDSFGAESRATTLVTVTGGSSGGRFGGGLGALLLLPLALAGLYRRRRA